MKRYLCPKHAHHIKTKPTTLSATECTLCRWEKRPWTLGDFAVELENIAMSLRFAQEDPWYDPHGITYAQDISKFIVNWLKAIHPAYRKNIMDELNKVV